MTDPSQVADLLHSAAIHVLRRVSELETTIGRARLSALSVVVFRGPLNLGELARAEGVRSATMTGIVNGLEGERLVTRRPDANDRRATLIEATHVGKRLLAGERRRRIELIASRLGDLAPDDLDLLWRAGRVVESRFALAPWESLDPST